MWAQGPKALGQPLLLPPATSSWMRTAVARTPTGAYMECQPLQVEDSPYRLPHQPLHYFSSDLEELIKYS